MILFLPTTAGNSYGAIKKYIFLFFILSAFSSTAQVAATQFGPVQGHQNGLIYEFLGIPYAKAPVDSLRWKAPRNPDTRTTVLTASNFAPVCPQKHFNQGDSTYTVQGNEDCLFLNIWTPAVGAGQLPVLVFIHGGGNQQGGASEISGGTQLYNGKNMAQRGNAVVVTIQYRLGPLGFLVHPGLEAENANNRSGNYAVLDQLLALNWVKHNIANFGGDSSKVMLFGESGGGVDAGNLLTTPLAAGLFQRACIESATPLINSYSNSRGKGIAFVDSFIASGTDIQKIATLRSYPADSLLKFETPPVSGGAVQLSWQPAIDSLVFFNTPNLVFQSGNFNKVPLMIGSNSEEMSISTPPVVYPFMVSALINTQIPQAYQPQALALYPPGNTTSEARQSYIGILTDAQFTATTRRTARCVSSNQTELVWRYFFTYKHSVAALASLGSYHGMELFYVFNNWENATLGSGPLFHSSDDSVQQLMLKYWVNFAKTGNPNSAGLVTWPAYSGPADCYLQIKATPDGSQCGIRTLQSNLWDNVTGFTGCSSTLPITLVSFDAIKSGQQADVSWRLDDITEVTHFELEKSRDGITFTPATTVFTQATQTNYTYKDPVLYAGYNYYRLKVWTKDGHFFYSKIIFLASNHNHELVMFPNPVSTELLYHLKTAIPTPGYLLRIFSADGKIVYQAKIKTGNAMGKINVASLTTGIYLFRLYGNNEIYENVFIKN